MMTSNMKAKYESLPLKELRAVAKARGLRNISALRKAQLVERMLEEDINDQQKAAPQAGDSAESQAAPAPKKGRRKKAAANEEKEEGKQAEAVSGEENQDKEKSGKGKPEIENQPEAEASEKHGRGKAQAGTKTRAGSRKRTAPSRSTASVKAGEAEAAGHEGQAEGQEREDARKEAGRGYEQREQKEQVREREQNHEHEQAGEQNERPRRRVQKASTSYRERTERSGQTARKERTNSSVNGFKRERASSSDQGQGFRKERASTYEQGFRREKTAVSDQGQAVRREFYVNPAQAAEAAQEGTRQEYREENGLFQTEENQQERLGPSSSATGILEVLPDGYGFIRSSNYLPGDDDVYVSPSQIRKFNLKTGDWITGGTRMRTTGEKFSALVHINSVNGFAPIEASRRMNFEDMTPIFPNQRIRLERSGSDVSMRIVDLVSPVGKGQRGMIVSPPKAGKTTLLKQIAKSILQNAPEMHMIILLIDERPEEVTDMKETIQGPNVEVIYSTFDELPEHHKRVSEMVIERAKRLVEHKKDVIILLDSITRLARAYNLTVPPSGRTLSGGLDPAALHMPKRFFGSARNMREGGSLTILATALVDTGSKMDDVVYEEFKGTGNMELILDRRLSERRVFPAIDIIKSGTRREDLLLSPEEREAAMMMRRSLNGMKAEEAAEQILNLFVRTRSNKEFCDIIRKRRYL